VIDIIQYQQNKQSPHTPTHWT